MTAREAFERARLKSARFSPRDAGGNYLDPVTQAEWQVWCAAWQACLEEVSGTTRVWVEKSLMAQIRRTLSFYANPQNFTPTGRGLFYRPKPADSLSLLAQEAVNALDVPGTP